MRRLYCIYDLVAQQFIMGLVVQHHDAPVIRMFYDLLSDKSQALNAHPADYELRCTGFIDDAGVPTPFETLVVATGKGWLISKEPTNAEA